jgi:hypothetical protein
MGILTLQKWIPDSDGFGRGSDLGGFGWIPDPGNGISQPWPGANMHRPTQPERMDILGSRPTTDCLGPRLGSMVLLCVGQVAPLDFGGSPKPETTDLLGVAAQVEFESKS